MIICALYRITTMIFFLAALAKNNLKHRGHKGCTSCAIATEIRKQEDLFEILSRIVVSKNIYFPQSPQSYSRKARKVSNILSLRTLRKSSRALREAFQLFSA